MLRRMAHHHDDYGPPLRNPAYIESARLVKALLAAGRVDTAVWAKDHGLPYSKKKLAKLAEDEFKRLSRHPAVRDLYPWDRVKLVVKQRNKVPRTLGTAYPLDSHSVEDASKIPAFMRRVARGGRGGRIQIIVSPQQTPAGVKQIVLHEMMHFVVPSVKKPRYTHHPQAFYDVLAEAASAVYDIDAPRVGRRVYDVDAAMCRVMFKADTAGRTACMLDVSELPRRRQRRQQRAKTPDKVKWIIQPLDKAGTRVKVRLSDALYAFMDYRFESETGSDREESGAILERAEADEKLTSVREGRQGWILTLPADLLPVLAEYLRKTVWRMDTDWGGEEQYDLAAHKGAARFARAYAEWLKGVLWMPKGAAWQNRAMEWTSGTILPLKTYWKMLSEGAAMATPADTRPVDAPPPPFAWLADRDGDKVILSLSAPEFHAVMTALTHERIDAAAERQLAGAARTNMQQAKAVALRSALGVEGIPGPSDRVVISLSYKLANDLSYILNDDRDLRTGYASARDVPGWYKAQAAVAFALILARRAGPQGTNAYWRFSPEGSRYTVARRNQRYGFIGGMYEEVPTASKR